MKLKLGLITKNKFYLKEKDLIVNNFLFYEDVGIYGFKLNEIEKLLFIGFTSKDEFNGYKYNLEEIKEIVVVGPEFREKERYILDRLINIFKTLKEIWKKRYMLKDLDVIVAPFFEYVVFEFLLLKLICRKTKFILYIIGDYPELNYRKNKSFFLKYFLIISIKISQFLADENWVLSNYLFKKYRTKNSLIMYSSSVKEKEIGRSKNFNNIINPTLLFVGRLEPEKRPEISLMILKKLIEKGYKFYLKIVGDGRLRKKLEEIKNELNLENCYFWGWAKKRENLLEIYKDSNILIFSSEEGEGLGFVILEAMSQGLIVITTKCGGPEEIIENNINGFLIDNTTKENIVNDFVEKIEFLINNPDLCNKISQNNIEKAKEFTIEKFFQKQKERILKLLKK